MPEFTKDQLLCIETSTKDMLVSAGAGSGKTTVLAERIMRRIEKGADIKDFLVVTFTNTAAADLKAKLSDRLEKLSQASPESKAYRRMLYSIDSADICTIDSFCLQYVKQNAAVLGLTDGCSVGDEALCAALLTAAADGVLTELCEGDEPTADLLLDNFASHKNDDGLISAVTVLYKKLRAYPFYIEWLDSVIKAHEEELCTLKEKGFFACKAGKQIKESVKARLDTARECLLVLQASALNDKQGLFADRLEEITDSIAAGLNAGYKEFCAASPFPRLTRPGNCCDEYIKAFEKLKATIKSLSLYVRTDKQLMEEYVLEGEVLKALYTFTARLDKAYTAAKRERGILDFADAEHLMLGLLLTSTEDGYIKTGLCKSISGAYSEVFIDEYQDVSPLQDAIFSAIGAGKRFMVGDVKQSIYGFRNAYPDIFTAYRDSFAPAENGKENARVFLKENFRCDKNIIDFCNCIFDRVFTKASAGTDYKTERLIQGKQSVTSAPVRLLLLENADVYTEAELVAEEAVRLLGKGYRPKDIALLTRKVEHLNVFGAALKKRGVPCYAAKTKLPLLKQPEVLLALSLLRVIDNPTDDISLAALLRSPIFRFSANDLLALRRGGSLYDDLCYAVEEANRFINARYRLRGNSKRVCAPPRKPLLIKKANTPLAEKCKAFLEKLRVYRTKALFLPVNELIWYLYEDTHLLLFAPKGKEKQHKDNLFALLSLAQGLENGVYKGVSTFTEYISRLEGDNRSPDAPTPTADNAVSLMTIHGSKGLEFPVVFVSGCGVNLLKANKKDAVSANYRLGVSVKLAKQAKAWKTSTLLRDTALKTEDARVIAEEYRIFYVAFTRARERLYISTAIKGEAEKYLNRHIAEPTVYSDLFLPTAGAITDGSFKLDIINAEGLEIPVTALSEAEQTECSTDIELPPLELGVKAPERVTAKYSVSTLTRLDNGLLGVMPPARIDDKRPAFAESGVANGAKRGTANHVFLQFANFSLAEKDVEAEAKRLFEKGFLDKEQLDLLNLPALKLFFSSSLYGEIKASRRVYREKRFTTRVSSSLFTFDNADGVLLQGVIDCFFENEKGCFTLVDYKTDAVREGGEQQLIEKHETQLNLYAQYIEKLTGKAVSDTYIYSLTLNKAIPIGKPKTS